MTKEYDANKTLNQTKLKVYKAIDGYKTGPTLRETNKPIVGNPNDSKTWALVPKE